MLFYIPVNTPNIVSTEVRRSTDNTRLVFIVTISLFILFITRYYSFHGLCFIHRCIQNKSLKLGSTITYSTNLDHSISTEHQRNTANATRAPTFLAPRLRQPTSTCHMRNNRSHPKTLCDTTIALKFVCRFNLVFLVFGRVKDTPNFISSGSKIVKRLRRRQYDPLIIETTIGLVLGHCTALCRLFLKHCTLTNKAVGTIWRALSKPPQRRQGPDLRPLWLLVGTPSAIRPELAFSRAEHSLPYSDVTIYIFAILYLSSMPYL